MPQRVLLGSVLFGADEEVTAFVASRIPGMERGFGPCAALGIVKGGALVGGAVYHGYQPFKAGGVIEVSIASESVNWAWPATLRTLFRYPFVQLGCVRMGALIARRNVKARRFIKSLGFREEGKHPLGWLGREDAFSYGLLRRDCRFL